MRLDDVDRHVRIRARQHLAQVRDQRALGGVVGPHVQAARVEQSETRWDHALFAPMSQPPGFRFGQRRATRARLLAFDRVVVGLLLLGCLLFLLGGRRRLPSGTVLFHIGGWRCGANRWARFHGSRGRRRRGGCRRHRRCRWCDRPLYLRRFRSAPLLWLGSLGWPPALARPVVEALPSLAVMAPVCPSARWERAAAVAPQQRQAVVRRCGHRRRWLRPAPLLGRGALRRRHRNSGGRWRSVAVIGGDVSGLLRCSG